MKTFDFFPMKIRLFIKAIPLLLIFIVGCSKQELFPAGLNENSNEMNLKSSVVHVGTITFQGYTRFDIYAKKEHKVISDGHTDMYLLCSAELVFTDKENFVLTTTEWIDTYGGTPFRKISFTGKMSPDGQLNFTWPETWLEGDNWDGNLEPHSDVLAQMRDHMGYDLSGPGINKNTLNYVGYFDNNKLFADFHIIGFYREPGSMGWPYDTEVDGPILVNFSIDLDTSE
jgi:hypothetical protein